MQLFLFNLARVISTEVNDTDQIVEINLNINLNVNDNDDNEKFSVPENDILSGFLYFFSLIPN